MVDIIKIDDILVGDDRQRTTFPEAEMAELKESIEANGLFSAILVRPTNKKTKPYMLVAGERRLRTITSFTEPFMYGDQEIPPGHVPALVKYFSSDMSAYEVELHENIIRQNLSWQDKARAIERLHKLKQSQNPQHTKGATAELIEEEDTGDEGARRTTRRRVNDALMVANYLDDPEVQKARDLKEAGKIVSRKMEAEALARLRELKNQQVALEAEKPKETKDPADAAGLLNLLDQPAKKKKIGILLEGDVREKLLEVADGSISVVLTDPPYGIDADQFNDGGFGTQEHEYEDTLEYALDLYAFVINQLDRVCTPNAHVYMFCDISLFLEVREMFGPDWWVRRKPLVWSKGVGKLADGTPSGWTSTHEFILFAKRGDRPTASTRPDVLSIRPDKDKIHAAQKPIDLYVELLQMSAVPGDNVLDTFAGSGVIYHAARKLMLDPIGIEQSDKFIEVCKLAQEGRFDIVLDDPDSESE